MGLGTRIGAGCHGNDGGVADGAHLGEIKPRGCAGFDLVRDEPRDGPAEADLEHVAVRFGQFEFDPTPLAIVDLFELRPLLVRNLRVSGQHHSNPRKSRICFVAYFAAASAGAEWDAGEAETAVNEDGAGTAPVLRNINPPPNSTSSPATAAQSHPDRRRCGLAGDGVLFRVTGV